MEEEHWIGKLAIFFVKCLVYYPVVLPYRAVKFVLDRRPPTPPVIPVKDRPATLQETAGAETHIRLAHKFFMKGWEDRDYTDNAMRSLSLASNAINEARKLDPAAKVTVEQYGDKKSYTVDELSSHILFSQAELLRLGALRILEKTSSDMSVETLKEAHAKMHKYLRDAVTASEAAVRYQPTNAKYRVSLAKSYALNSQKKQAGQIIQAVLAGDPHNMDALEVKAEFSL